MPFRACTVAFRDASGFRHTTTVEGETVYEAAVYAVVWWRAARGSRPPRLDDVMEITAKDSPTTHRVTLATIHTWLLDSTGRTRDEVERKKKLRRLLAHRR